MRIRFWGVRGSIPSSLRFEEVEEKIFHAIVGLPDINTTDPEAVWAYIRDLPPLVRGTAGGNTPCVEIQAGGNLLVVDAGSGLHQLGLELLKGPFGRGEGTLHLFISHPHWDHIQGFPMFMPAFVPGNRIFIYGIHDVKKALEDQQRPFNWPVSLSYMRAEMEFIRLQEGAPFDISRVRVNTIRNHHSGDSYCYRFEDQHSIFVYASDAEYKQLDGASVQPHIEFFRNADVLIFDSQYTLRESWHGRADWGHSSAMIGVDLARLAGVKKLVLFHHDPTYSDAELQEIQATAVAYQAEDTAGPSCEVVVAYEGLTINIVPPTAIDLQLTPDGEAAILTPASTFDERGVDQLMQQLACLAEEEALSSSIIDLSYVETLTTASLKSLVTLYHERKGAPVVLAAPSDSVREVIKLGGHLDYFAIYPSVEAALAAVQAREALNLPGHVIEDRYQIQDKVGESQLGTVLRATDIHLNRRVALKIFSPAFSEETIDRFMRQAQQTTNLNHQNIVNVFDWGMDEGYSYKVEEFVDQPTLYDLLLDTDGPIPVDQAMSIALDIAVALEYAHSWGVVHGDLKPQNVFLTDDGARLSGFGLGRLEEGRSLLDAPLVFLTAAYLAPEQILGQPLDICVDLYAMGVILYQLFTGRMPFDGVTLDEIKESVTSRLERAALSRVKATDQALMWAHLHTNPRSPRDLNPSISLVLDHLILKLLAKEPDGRYSSPHQVRRILASLTASMAGGSHTLETGLVGREEQLQVLKSCWGKARARRGQLVFVTGELGIGKTSLARWAAAQCEPPLLLVGNCRELEEGPAYCLLAEVVQNYLATWGTDSLADEFRQLLSNFSRLVPEIGRMLPDLPEPSALEPRQEQVRLATGLVQLVKQATQKQPWLLILDDLQWADRSSLELLRHLCRHLPEMALLIVGIYHDVGLAQDHPLTEVLRELDGHPACHRIRLDRLSNAEVRQFLANLWAQEAPPALAERIYQRTLGNPLYVEEVAQGLVDDGLVLKRNGVWQFPEVEEIRLPENARVAIWRRIRRLGPDEQERVRQASVLGQTFRFDDLRSMGALSGLSEWEILEHLDTALERQFIQEVPGKATFRFYHTEIQSVLYTDLGMPQRRMFHGQAGEVMERRVMPESARIAEELAHHFTEAGEVEKALIYSIQAARRAEEAYANQSALAWYNRTLELLDKLGLEKASEFESLRQSVHESLGEILTRSGLYDEALEHYASALFKWLGREPSDTDEAEAAIEAARVYLFGAELYFRQSKYDEAISWCQKSLDIVSQVSTREGQEARARACLLLGSICIRSGDLPYAVQFCRESVQVYRRINDLVGQASAYNTMGLAYYHMGDWSQARESYHRSLAIRKATDDIEGQGEVRNNLALIRINRGEWDQALNLLEQSQDIWKQIGVGSGEASTLNNLALLHISQENWSEAQASLSRSEAIFADLDSDEYLPELARRWGEYYLGIGEIDQALNHTLRSIELGMEQGSLLEEGLSCRTLGQVHMARGEWEPAEAALYQSLQILKDLGSGYEIAKTQLFLVRLMVERDSDSDVEDDVRDYLAQALQTFESLGAEVDLNAARDLERQLHRDTGVKPKA
jgi:phosphoribosyl 1,2-cyclic phosphodiesterase/tetratricopeptide (TPR) repeat protein/anti-anti-sigma regulatory factor/tRNA A-37 threonylcarbamoyl transferase component Bud32